MDDYGVDRATIGITFFSASAVVRMPLPFPLTLAVPRFAVWWPLARRVRG